jgi:hypothetical protein
MKRTKKEEQLAKIRKAHERITEIWKLRANLKPTKLPKKIFSGHWRFFKVRDDIMRCSEGEQIAKIVAVCNHWVSGNKKKPESYRCSTEVMINPADPDSPSTWRNGQELLPLSQEEFNAAKFPDFFAKKWFAVQRNIHRAGTKVYERPRFFPQVPHRMLEFSYKTAYITEVTNPDPELDSELDKLYDFMDRVDGWKKIGESNKRDEYDLGLIKKKIKGRLLDKEAKEALGGMEMA